MAEENRRFPPPPPPRPIPPRPQEQNNEIKPQLQTLQTEPQVIQPENREDKQTKKTKVKLNEQAQNILYICGCAFSFVIAIVCIILAIVL